MFRKLVERLLQPSGGPETPDSLQRKRLAVAALLVETCQVDRQTTEAERAAVLRIVRERFGLDESAAGALVRTAEGSLEVALEDWVFTHEIRHGFSAAERREVVGMLWDVAYADGVLAEHESRLVERVASAIAVPGEDVEEERRLARERSDRTGNGGAPR